MRAYARAEDEIKEELFPKEAPRGLYREVKMYKLELHLPRRRLRREPHKFADITLKKKNIFC